MKEDIKIGDLFRVVNLCDDCKSLPNRAAQLGLVYEAYQITRDEVFTPCGVDFLLSEIELVYTT